MASGWKVLLGLGIAGGVGFGIKKAMAAGKPPLPPLPPKADAPVIIPVVPVVTAPVPVVPVAPVVYVPTAPSADAIKSAPEYKIKSKESLSSIARKVWKDKVSYDAAKLWLLLWSANMDTITDPNKVSVDQVIRVPMFEAFSSDDIEKALKYADNWQAYSGR